MSRRRVRLVSPDKWSPGKPLSREDRRMIAENRLEASQQEKAQKQAQKGGFNESGSPEQAD
ncbi:hypothetical protein N9917_00930 [Deltaproteobacteria bacterium]|nr:hypothetical protein [Deltaproteobacteria bacterium]